MPNEPSKSQEASTRPTGGTFTLRVGELETDPIPHDATPEEIQWAVDRLFRGQEEKTAQEFLDALGFHPAD